MKQNQSNVSESIQVLGGFDKPEILLVFNAGTKMKPEYPPAGGFEDFIFVTRQKTGNPPAGGCKAFFYRS
jgi:hypothetical protein